MKITENIVSKLKEKTSQEFSKLGASGTEFMKSTSQFLNSLGEEKNEEKPIIKRKIKKGNSKDLVGGTKLTLPIGKMYSAIGGEAKEATSAGGAGSFEGPLFSVTKKEMQEMKEFTPPKLTMFSDEAPKKVEAKEATGAGSSGSYETPAAWAKSTNKKDWRGKSKTQIPGGKFVQVKKKCKKFPYCNQGDINALKIFENETVKKVIKNISEKHGISENVIKSILSYELTKNK